MKKPILAIIILLIVFLVSVSYANVISVGEIKIEYNSAEELQAIFVAVKENMASVYKTVLFDAETYNETTYIVGETFPAGRYHVYPVVVSETNNDLYAQLLWWAKDEIDQSFCTDYVCAQWCRTVELTDGMKIKFSWDEDQRGVCIAMQKLPNAPTNLMNIFD